MIFYTVCRFFDLTNYEERTVLVLKIIYFGTMDLIKNNWIYRRYCLLNGSRQLRLRATDLEYMPSP